MSEKTKSPAMEHYGQVTDVLATSRIKVDGGYVYSCIDKGHEIGSSVFVPDLRTHLAAMAMQGELAGQFYVQPGFVANGSSNCWTPDKAHKLANNAVIFADALIKELNK